MAVVPMQKIRLAVYASDVDNALKIIQQAGAVEFKQTELEDGGQVTGHIFPNASLLPRVQHAVRFLEPYNAKVGLWRSLREGSKIELSEAEADKFLCRLEVAESIVSDIEQLQVDFAEINERIRDLTGQVSLLSDWESLPIKLVDMETKKTVTLLYRTKFVPAGMTLADVMSVVLGKQELPHHLVEVNSEQIAIVVANEPESVTKLKRLAEENDLEECSGLRGENLPAVELVRVRDELVLAKNEYARLHDQAEHFATTHLKTLQSFSDVISWQSDRYATLDQAVSTRFTVVFDGWLNVTKKTEIESAFRDKNIAGTLAVLPVKEGEEPPVDIDNGPLVKPFEAVTRLYGMPGYRDLDPTVFLAGFFFLFFGLSLTDVGYGLTLALLTGFALIFFKLDRSTRLFAQLLFMVGVGTVFVGVLFGGYLGLDMKFMPEWLQKLQVFDPVGDPLPVFYLALALGVFHVMVGMILKIYSGARNSRFLDSALDQGPWLFMFSVGILYILTVVDYVSLVSIETIGNLSLVAVLLIVLGSGRSGKGIIGKVIASASGLYAGVGYFSDILSYSRLLALGLATSALAYAVNLISGMVIDVPVVGIILAGIILVIGHVFTLAINTLGAFVHSARLQFVEFFGKFIAGTGRQFAPLRRRKKYLAVGDD